MPSSLVEQLQRDAKKQGAYQAKLAYIQYLMAQEQTPENKTLIDNLFEEITQAKEDMAQHHYHQAVYLRAQYLERLQASVAEKIAAYELVAKTSKYFLKAAVELAKLYKDIDNVKSAYYANHAKNHISEVALYYDTDDQSCEYRYKSLRLRFEQHDVSEQKYIDELENLLKHPELTDTLQAKIRFQMIRAHLNLFEATVDPKQKHLHAAKTQIQYFTQPPLKSLAKAEKVASIASHIHAAEQGTENKIKFLKSAPKYDTKDKPGLVRLLLNFINHIHKKLNQKKSDHNAEAKRSSIFKQEMKISLQKAEDLFAKTKPMATIRDAESNRSKLIYASTNEPPAGTIAYARALPLDTPPNSFQYFVKLLDGKVKTFFTQPSASIADIKRQIQASEGTPIDEQRIIFAGRQLQDDLTCADHNIHQESTLHLVLRLRGD